MKYLCYILFLPLLVACSREIKTNDVKSDSTSFAGATLGEKINLHFDKNETVEIDGGPYYYTKNKIGLGYQYNKDEILDSKIVSITYYCNKNNVKGNNSYYLNNRGESENLHIDGGLQCLSDVGLFLKSNDWKKVCLKPTSDYKSNTFYAIKNNAVFAIQPSNASFELEIQSFGLHSPGHRPEVGEHFEECRPAFFQELNASLQSLKLANAEARERKSKNEIDAGLNSAKSKSLSNIEMRLCETAKGNAIDKCVSMQTGMSGMASCNDAVSVANSACKRSDLTILSIIEEASKAASK